MLNARGFTLVELLVVITIISITGVFAFANFGSFGEDQKLKSATSDVQSLIRQAQTNATAHAKCDTGYNATWQVEFDNLNRNVNLKCQEPAGSPTLKKTQHLDPNITFQSPSGIVSCPTSFPVIINFASLTGKTSILDYTNCTLLTVPLQNSKTTTIKSISLTAGGRMFERPACDASGTQLTGLVGYWDFNQGSGTTVTDTNGNNGTWGTTPNWVTGKMGTAIQFTANNDRISTNITDVLNNDVHAIAFWINFQATDNNWRQILAYRPTGTDRSPGIWVYPNNLCIHWRYGPNNTGLMCAGPTGENSYFTVDTWYHIVGIKNGSALTFYVNGQLKDSATVDNPKPAGTAAIDFGQTNYSAAHVKIDEVRIYNRTLTDAEVAASYNGGGGCPLF